ncbi:biotin transporter BioY [candidate division KSB1 bacterium]|nr:biotin transporter BioY [candidate division KSB1 bacterium]
MIQRTKELNLAGLFAALTAVGAFIKIPFYPVPITMQTLVTIFAALALRPMWAGLSQMMYLMIGLIGLPVFATGGGLGYVTSPTFGYLLSLPVVAYGVSSIYHHYSVEKYWQLFLLTSIGSIFILLMGTTWLYLNFKIFMQSALTWQSAFESGLIIFLPGTILKSLLVIWLVKRLLPIINKEF